MSEFPPDLTAAPTYSEPVEPTHVHPDGRRTWWLTQDIRVTVYPAGHPHPFGYIQINDGAHQRLDSRCLETCNGAEVYLTPPVPGAA